MGDNQELLEVVSPSSDDFDISPLLDILNEVKENQGEIIEQNNKFSEYFIPSEEELRELKKQESKEQKKQEEELKKEREKQEEFYSNVETIALNTDTEVATQLLTDVSTLMQVNIMTSGLLIGIVCMSLFAKFFKK